MWNEFLVIALAAWASAQFSKILIVLASTGRLEVSRMWSSGGMPSGHSALVSSIVVAVGRADGVQSTSFAIAFAFAAIVMYDAAGVRQAVGLHGQMLNNLIDRHRDLRGQKIRELLGHTRLEVLGGLLLGSLIALSWP